MCVFVIFDKNILVFKEKNVYFKNLKKEKKRFKFNFFIEKTFYLQYKVVLRTVIYALKQAIVNYAEANIIFIIMERAV